MKKTYLGDAVYAEIEHGMIKLTTEDGRSSTNTIFLEMEVYEALQAYVARAVKFYAEKSESTDETL